MSTHSPFLTREVYITQHSGPFWDNVEVCKSSITMDQLHLGSYVSCIHAARGPSDSELVYECAWRYAQETMLLITAQSVRDFLSRIWDVSKRVGNHIWTMYKVQGISESYMGIGYKNE